MEDNQMFQEEMPGSENRPEEQVQQDYQSQPEEQVQQEQPVQPEEQVQPEQPVWQEQQVPPDQQTEKPKAPVQDYYADGTPVRPEGHSASIPGNDRTQQGAAERGNPGGNRPQPPLRQYQFGSEWQQRQIAPQPYGKDPKKNGKGGLFAAIAILLVISILGGALFAAARAFTAHVRGPEEYAQPSAQETAPKTEANNESSAAPAPTLIPAAPSANQAQESTPSGQMSVADVAEISMPAMVSITTMSVQQVHSFFGQIENREVPGAASGIIVGQTEKELLIATNDHVIAGAKELSVAFVDEEVVEGVVKGTDEMNDLAIVAVSLDDIKAETKGEIRVISIGDSDKVRIGEEVVAIGNALGFGQSVSAGVISAKNRTVKLEDGDHVLLQTDAAINPGNSGGALLNMRGELIGINEIKYVREDTEGIGYAIPITFAKPILDELMNRETRTKVAEGESGYLGVNCITVTEEYANAYRIPIGVFVDNVIENEAADKAGIQPRDIITKIGDVPVTTAQGLVEELRYYAAGDKVTITVSRLTQDNDYKEIELEVTLGKWPADLDASRESSPSGEQGGNTWQMPGGNR